MADVTKKEIEDRLKDYILDVCPEIVRITSSLASPHKWDDIYEALNFIVYSIDNDIDEKIARGHEGSLYDYSQSVYIGNGNSIDFRTEIYNLLDRQLAIYEDFDGTFDTDWKKGLDASEIIFVPNGKVVATDATRMFASLSNVIYIGDIDTSSCVNCSYMFSDTNLSARERTFDFSSATNLNQIFRLAHPKVKLLHTENVKYYGLISTFPNPGSYIYGIDFSSNNTDYAKSGFLTYWNARVMEFVPNSIMSVAQFVGPYAWTPYSIFTNSSYAAWLSWQCWKNVFECLHDYSEDTTYSSDPCLNSGYKVSMHNWQMTDEQIATFKASNNMTDAEFTEFNNEIVRKGWSLQ